jgi:carbamoyltransferase
MFLLDQITHRMIVRYHPEIGHLYVPNLRARIPNENGGYQVTTNSIGFRSDVEFTTKRNGRPRILFLGDSVTAADGCDNQQRFAELVGQALDAEVYNFGLSGSGTDQHLLIYRHFARHIEADLLVMCVYVENVERIKVSARETVDRTTGEHVLVPKPYFRLEQDQLVLHNVPVPRDRPKANGSSRATYQAIVPDRLRSARNLLDWYRHDPRLRPVRRVVAEKLPQLRPWMLALSGFEPYPDYADDGSTGVQLLKAILRSIVAESAPLPVLLVPIPTFFHFHDVVAPSYQRHFESLADPQRPVAVGDVLTRLLDLPLRTRRQLVFRTDKTHFSPEGHRRVADAIANEITTRGLIPRSAFPRRKTAGETGRRPAVSARRDVYVLGVSCFYHDSAACLVRDGELVAAAEEERFTRTKNDRRFPQRAVNYCLEEAGIHQDQLAAVVYYDNAPRTFERLLHTAVSLGDRGKDMWLRAMPSWSRYKLRLPSLIRSSLRYEGLLLQEEHHRSHAASAFYPSPFDRAAILTIDGVGEWATAAIGVGDGGDIKILKELHFPHSLGLLYSAFTQFTGFKVNSGEYKMMGLAPYGEPRYVETILDHLVDLRPDGSLALNLDYFAYLGEPRMTNARFADLFGGPARKSDERITKRDMDIARSIQAVTEEAMLRMARHAHELTGESRLCLAGGVALNCVANGRILREGPFRELWLQPAAGDAGCALGAALDVYHTYFEKARRPHSRSLQKGSLLGPSYSDDEIRAFLDTHGYSYHRLSAANRAETIAKLLEAGKVVGHFANRMEFGPRALGARSILGDARNRDMQVNLNVKIKYRESFRPFAPSVTAEKVGEYFEFSGESPYMLLVAPVKSDRRLPFDRGAGEDMLAVVRQPRSDVPAVTHVDYSARLQTVHPADDSSYHAVIEAFEQATGCATIVNTSFNVRGEPIICTPFDAYRCFMRTNMDVLVMENSLLLKEEQPPWPEAKGHVENDDLTEVTPVDDPMQGTLEQIFTQDVVPLARHTANRVTGGMDDTQRHSYWRDYRGPADPRHVFTIAPSLDLAKASTEDQARAIVSAFSPDPVDIREQCVPLIVKLLKLGEKHRVDQDLEEEVPESIYVMF